MIKAPIPVDEEARLDALRSYRILDTLPEESYQNLAKLASLICEVPIAMVTFMDEDSQFIKCSYGVDLRSAPRDISFCGHALLTPFSPMVVEDTLEDHRFFDSPYVTGDYKIRFYAGVPILSSENQAIGTFCLYDTKPKKLTANQLDALNILVGQVQNLLDLHQTSYNLTQSKKKLEQHNEVLKDFSYKISHDIKAPVRNIRQLTAILIEEYPTQLSGEVKEIVTLLRECGEDAENFIDGLIEYTRYTFKLKDDVDHIEIKPFLNKITSNLLIPQHIDVSVYAKVDAVSVPVTAFKQVMSNLIGNSAKYNDKQEGRIDISIREEDGRYHVSVKDNGIGIPPSKLKQIFDLFYRVDDKRENTLKSSGIGLTIVRKLIKEMDGDINVESVEGEGTTMNFYIRKY